MKRWEGAIRGRLAMGLVFALVSTGLVCLVIATPVRAAQSQDVERPRGEEPEWPRDQDFERR